ncbi:MAG: imidazole glycerol phosphate synthase cyclase subunit [Pseudomonadota bacterium]|nr:imidazole glycerol phosphate synthase cyclase subunit [Pseudomonadota bacterium]
MANVRLIARLDIKGPNLIKGVRFEGVRKIGDPQEYAQRYYAEGIDEIIYIDAVASLYGRNSLTDVVRRTAENVFIPITVGGGLKSVEDASAMLRSGADKVAINTEATKRPDLISEIAARFGAQCMVLSIQAKRLSGGGWEVYRDLGREHTGLDAVEWARRGQQLGAGEILVTSVDQEGTQDGFDIELVKAITSATTVPVIASGGLGAATHATSVVSEGGANAVAIGRVLHYETLTLSGIRDEMANSNIEVRQP